VRGFGDCLTATCQAEYEYLAYSWDATEEWTRRGSDGSFVGRE